MAEQTAQQAAPEAAVGEVDEFEALLKKEFRPKSDAAHDEVKRAVRTLAAQALEDSNVVPDAVVKTIKRMISEIDAKLTKQINEIIHHEDFQQLEGAWRGLHFLCGRTETGTGLKLKFMSVSKKELQNEFSDYTEADWDRSPFFEKLYEKGYGSLNGQPVACIVGDYHFDHTGPDVELLSGISKIAAASHAPFIAGASPELLNLDTWQGLPARKQPLDETIELPTHMAWRALRESEDARYIGLACPRFLARRAYGENNPIDEFAFKEDTGGDDASKFCWANSAYAMAANITRAYSLYGWCSRIRGVESGGLVEKMPTHVFMTETGSWGEQCPAEVSITKRREKEMADLGLMPLVYQQNTTAAAFIGAQSLHAPPKFDDNTEEGRTATKNAALGARLPYIFACSRFAHYLNHMVYNKVGSYMERDAMQRWLGDWIQGYVDNNASSSDDQKARRPLSAARVEVTENEEDPGMYDAKFFLRPHYQLEGAKISLRLVSKLPSEGS